MIFAIMGRSQGKAEMLRQIEEQERELREIEEERERVWRILRGLQDIRPKAEYDSEEDELPVLQHFEAKGLTRNVVPCERWLAGHLIDWFTSGFQ